RGSAGTRRARGECRRGFPATSRPSPSRSSTRVPPPASADRRARPSAADTPCTSRGPPLPALPCKQGARPAHAAPLAFRASLPHREGDGYDRDRRGIGRLIRGVELEFGDLLTVRL